MWKIEKNSIKLYIIVFKFDTYLFSIGTTTINKLDDSILVAHFRT